MSRDMNQLHPNVRPRLEAALDELRERTGQDIKVSWTYRNKQEQTKAVSGGFSNANYPMSWHNNTDEHGEPASLAIDIFNNVPSKLYDIDWNIVKEVCEEYELEWGGLWKYPDKPHLQYTEGHTRQQIIKDPKLVNNFKPYTMKTKHDYFEIMKKEVPEEEWLFKDWELDEFEKQMSAKFVIGIHRSKQ